MKALKYAAMIGACALLTACAVLVPALSISVTKQELKELLPNCGTIYV